MNVTAGGKKIPQWLSALFALPETEAHSTILGGS